jgi:circadian clock protein KaiC
MTAPFLCEPVSLPKASTGIVGLDEITRGGIPRGRTTLVVGGPGCGKTVVALQFAVTGAIAGERGIFVSFEESQERVTANAATFGWNLAAMHPSNLYVHGAQLSAEDVRVGNYEISALLASMEALARKMGASRIVFDAVDVLLSVMSDTAAERNEFFRLQEWLNRSGLTAVITAKRVPTDLDLDRYAFLQYMADCVIELGQNATGPSTVRHVQVRKFRGSAYSPSQFPLGFGRHGAEVAAPIPPPERLAATTRRVSTGIPRLDAMLDGGYYAGSSVLISGSPGTAKSTLASLFISESCARGEKSLYVTFDESAQDVVRNMRSVNIDLQQHIDSGVLKIIAPPADGAGTEECLLDIIRILDDHDPRSLVLDPLSSLANPAGNLGAGSLAVRLIRVAKQRGILLVCTCLLGGAAPLSEGTPIDVSSIADTWIHLTYAIGGGERNRAMTIVKARGSDHSNQVRELILTREGVDIADVYIEGGDVLLGTARWERAVANQLEEERYAAAIAHRERELQMTIQEIDSQIKALQERLKSQQAGIDLLSAERRLHDAQSVHRRMGLAKRRGASLEGSGRPPGDSKLFGES